MSGSRAQIVTTMQSSQRTGERGGLGGKVLSAAPVNLKSLSDIHDNQQTVVHCAVVQGRDLGS